MSTPQAEMAPVEVHVENVGGISRTDISVPPGVTVLVGQNATNRTSLLQGITAALGSKSASLKADCDSGYAEVTIDGDTHFQRADRKNGRVVWDGEPYLEDPVAADLFAFFLESNDARRAVSRGEDLREVILRPIDTDAIEQEIRELQTRRQTIEERLADLDDLEAQHEQLVSKQSRLEDEVEELRSNLAEKRDELASADTASSGSDADRTLEERMAELRETTSELEEVKFQIATERESIEALETDLEEVSAELHELDEADTDPATIESAIRDHRERKRELDSRLSELQRLVQFNRELMDDGSSLLDAALGDLHDRSAEAVTQDLVNGSSTICWTCGTRVPNDSISETVEALKSYRQELLDEQREIETALDSLESQKKELSTLERRRADLESRQETIEREIADREETVTELTHRRGELEERIGSLEEEVEALQAETDEQVRSEQEALNELEYELGRTENELDRVRSNVETIEKKLDTREELRADRERITEELTDARERVERIETRAIDQFNEHMASILDILEYENIARIWLERRVDESGRGTADREFDLHIVRESEDGAVYEDEIDHLSESERRLTGLVFGLAGYLSHELYEDLPFLILDSLEAIDAQRIAALLAYIQEYADYLIVALLPEDAEYVTADERIETIA